MSRTLLSEEPPASEPRVSPEDRLRAIEIRIVKLESEMKHLATEKDIADLKTLIAQEATRTTRWLIGVLLATLGAVVLALVRTFSV